MGGPSEAGKAVSLSWTMFSHMAGESRGQQGGSAFLLGGGGGKWLSLEVAGRQRGQDQLTAD